MIATNQNHFEDAHAQYVECDVCDGVGEELNGEPCRMCDGEGRCAVLLPVNFTPEDAACALEELFQSRGDK